MNARGFENLLLVGTVVTVEVALASMGLALVLGLLGAIAARSRLPAVRALSATYTTLVRGIPELLMILLVYFGSTIILTRLSALAGYRGHLDLSPFVAGVVALGFMYGAYSSEVVRGAIDAIPRGQTEAAEALGLRRGIAFRHVVLPQTWRLALPPLGNLFLALLKDTALISVIGANDLMRNTAIAVTRTVEPFTFYAIAALLYLFLTIVTTVSLGWLERHNRRGAQRAS